MTICFAFRKKIKFEKAQITSNISLAVFMFLLIYFLSTCNGEQVFLIQSENNFLPSVFSRGYTQKQTYRDLVAI